MEITSQIIAWITGLLGLASFQWWHTRKANRRLMEAQAALAEAQAEIAERKGNTEAARDDFHLVQELMEEIKDKTRLIRELNEARLADARKIHDLSLELYDKECSRKTCAFRQPAKPFVPSYPESDRSVFEYFGLQAPGDRCTPIL